MLNWLNTTFPETSKLAAHTRHVALGTYYPRRQLMPDRHCQGKTRAESGTCVWKFYVGLSLTSWVYSAQLRSQVGSVTGDQETWVQVPNQGLILPFWASFLSPTKLKYYTRLSPSCLPPNILYRILSFYPTSPGWELILAKS